MNWTNALAVFGAVTGASSLGWQMWSHRLTGGRVEVWPTRLKQEGRWWVRTSVSNVGRLDVTIVGYSIWRDIPGHRLKQALWRLRAIGRLGWRKARRTQMLFHPSVHFGAPVQIGSDAECIELPFVLKAGSMVSLPSMGLEVPDRIARQLRVSVHLGAGGIIRADVLDDDVLEPLRIDLDDYTGAWSLHIGPPTTD
ncbi:hypothetical protein ACIQPP_08445 [Streptomyces violaceusniger]|uniref:hypothetical protein n=1 Tax=Streptomyces violaceusniger TaxID=68280 RepID=UPI000997F19F|nr:hypothetical protein [Streptomyces hygroscopicus]AQW46679.1 hypothetical protein SHXM_00142 [Streptomyces hygroscopicus]